MQKKIINNEEGIALIITLSVMTVLIALALQLNSNSRSEVISSATSRDRFSLKEMAASGVEIGIGAVLIDLTADKEDNKYFDSLQEDWADTEKMAELANAFSFDEGKLDILIVDELGKIQVNALVVYPDSKSFNEKQKKIWERVLNYFVTDEDSFDFVGTSGIVSCMKDWLDGGDDDLITGMNGAESDYYQELDPPYNAQNGPLHHLEELVLIKGIKPEDFYGVGEMFQLSKYITVYGIAAEATTENSYSGKIGNSKIEQINKDIKAKKNGNSFTFPGKININTAESPVISVLLEEGDESLADDIIATREEQNGDGEYVTPLETTDWYKTVSGVTDSIKDSEAVITTKTDTFRITCTATKNNVSITAEAVIRRYMDDEKHKPDYEILAYQIDI